MAAPTKPWENARRFGSDVPFAGSSSYQEVGTSSNGPPPLPPRPSTVSSTSPWLGNNYMSPMAYQSPYCSPMFGGYGFNRYPNYGDNYGSWESSDFVRLAEEGSRQAFESIGSIVQAVGSVSMMLESTYMALHSSFRAVLGVADQMSRVKNHLTGIVSTLALVRWLNYFLRRLLYLIGIAKRNPEDEDAWRQSRPSMHHLHESGGLNFLQEERRSSWPILVFFAVVCGAPYLFWRLISQISGNGSNETEKWKTGESDHYVAVALYDFQGTSARELSFVAGDQILIAPKKLQPRVQGWLLGHRGNKTGLLPANYIKIQRFSAGNSGTTTTTKASS